jgi:hypothetical protein
LTQGAEVPYYKVQKLFIIHVETRNMMQFSLKTVIVPWFVPLCVGGLICLHLVAGCETVDKFPEEMVVVERAAKGLDTTARNP